MKGSIKTHGEGYVVTVEEEEHHGLGKKTKAIIYVIERFYRLKT